MSVFEFILPGPGVCILLLQCLNPTRDDQLAFFQPFVLICLVMELRVVWLQLGVIEEPDASACVRGCVKACSESLGGMRCERQSETKIVST